MKPLINIKKHFIKLDQAGVTKYSQENQKVILTNRIAIIMFIITIPYFFVFRYFGQKIASYSVIPNLLFYIYIIYLNKNKQFTKAKVLELIGVTLIIVYYTYLLGYSSGSHLILFPLAIVPLIIFNEKQKKLKVWCSGFPIITSIIIQLVFILVPSYYFFELPPVIDKSIYLLASITTFTFIILQLNIFYRSEKNIRTDLYLSKKELQKAYRDLQKSKKEAEELAMQSAYATLTRGIAHEIKNPMAMLQSRSEIVLNKLDNKEAVKKFAEVIIKNIKRLKKLIDTMLQYGGPMSTEKESFSINEMILELIDLSESKCQQKHIKLKTDLKNIPNFYGSKFFIYQALLNIIVNAIQYTPDNGMIIVSSDIVSHDKIENNKAIKLSIKDTGKGMSPQNIARVFDPYFSTKDKPENIGLGLSITYKIIQECKGRIEIKSKLEEGSEFMVFLPYL